MEWKETEIEGVVIRTLVPNDDDRGSLTELFRRDELQQKLRKGFSPAMGYMSVTNPGVMRGPHEHRRQTDVFVFLGRFELYLWKHHRKSVDPVIDLTTHIRYKVSTIPEVPCRVIVPPGVVHGYENVGSEPGTVFNFPDQLYAGWGRGETVDEIRHENDPETKYVPW